MKFTLVKGEKTITFETPDDSIEETFGFLVFGLFSLGYDMQDISNHILKLAEQIKKDHQNEPDQNSMSI